MRILISIALFAFALSLSAQDGMQVTLEASNDAKCLSINITSITPEDLHLKGQNYRFFYDDSKLDFKSATVNAELFENNFDSQVALHRDGLSKDIDGKIPFETTMGFVSMNVMPQNDILDFVPMTFWKKTSVADVCFAQEVNPADVIIASKEVTSEYSRAYCVFDSEPAQKAQFSSDLESMSADDEDID